MHTRSHKFRRRRGWDLCWLHARRENRNIFEITTKIGDDDAQIGFDQLNRISDETDERTKDTDDGAFRRKQQTSSEEAGASDDSARE